MRRPAPTRLAEYPLLQFALLRLVAPCDVELERTSHVHDPPRRPRRHKPALVEVALGEDARERTEHVGEEHAPHPVARRTAVADARIHEEERHTHSLRPADEVRPYLALGQHDRARPDCLQRALDEIRKVERVVYEDVFLGDFTLRHLPPSRRRRREAEADIRLCRAPLAHQLPGHLHLANRHSMYPYERLAGAPQRGANVIGIEREPVAHPRGISPTPQHPREKPRQKERVDCRKKQIVYCPLHLQRIIPKTRLWAQYVIGYSTPAVRLRGSDPFGGVESGGVALLRRGIEPRGTDTC